MNRQDLMVTRRGLRFLGRRLPCSVGRGGIRSDKREGDAATPAGSHRITGCLYRADRMAPPNAWAVPIRTTDCWSDDSDDPAYNMLVRGAHEFRHENLFRADRLYDLVLLTDWNRPQAVPGRGSAIFVHRWRSPGYPTQGCVALAAIDLLWVARRLSPATRLLIS